MRQDKVRQDQVRLAKVRYDTILMMPLHPPSFSSSSSSSFYSSSSSLVDVIYVLARFAGSVRDGMGGGIGISGRWGGERGRGGGGEGDGCLERVGEGEGGGDGGEGSEKIYEKKERALLSGFNFL